MTRTHRVTLALIISCTIGEALYQPSRVWAAENESLHFYTRIGSHQLDEVGNVVRGSSDVNELMPEVRPLDIGAGMNYMKGGIHLQIGPRFDLTSPSLLPQQKVIMEGQIGVRW